MTTSVFLRSAIFSQIMAKVSMAQSTKDASVCYINHFIVGKILNFPPMGRLVV